MQRIRQAAIFLMICAQQPKFWGWVLQACSSHGHLVVWNFLSHFSLLRTEYFIQLIQWPMMETSFTFIMITDHINWPSLESYAGVICNMAYVKTEMQCFRVRKLPCIKPINLYPARLRSYRYHAWSPSTVRIPELNVQARWGPFILGRLMWQVTIHCHPSVS